METALRVLIAGPVATPLARLLSEERGIDVVATTPTPLETIATAMALRPDIIIADVDVAEPMNIPAIDILNSMHPRPVVVVLSPDIPEPAERKLTATGQATIFDLTGNLDLLPDALRRSASLTGHSFRPAEEFPS